MTSDYHQAIVIGAGIAGIKSSIDLTRNGIDNLILEARDRLGGRLYTIKTESGIPIDIGASWFHDCLVNPVLHKACKQGHIKFYYDDGRFDIYTRKHGLVDDNLKLKPVAEEIADYFGAVCSEKYAPETDISVREACYDYLKRKGYTLTEDQMRYAPQLARYVELWIGTSWESLSARTICSDVHLGRNAMVTNGYATFYNDELNELAEFSHTKPSQLVGSKILLNSVVYKIRFDDLTKRIIVSVHDESSGKDKVYECSYLLCSAPLSILKLTDYSAKGAIEWQPPLPTNITQKLQRVSFSSLGKVFLEFDSCFWPKTSDRFLCLSDPDEEITEAIRKNRDMNFSRTRNSSIYALDPESSPDPFHYSVLFMNLWRAAGVPVLLALISDPLTHYIESTTDKKIWDFFKPLVANISGREPPLPVSIHHTNWSNDPFSRGSYTGLTIGDDVSACIESLTEAKDIFDGKGRVRFMGEGITESGNGCVHGAWETGKREAAKVVGLVNKCKL